MRAFLMLMVCAGTGPVLAAQVEPGVVEVELGISKAKAREIVKNLRSRHGRWSADGRSSTDRVELGVVEMELGISKAKAREMVKNMRSS
jgi:hypothetical protein